ncbi:uncharacterized mitochondrial protein AtMg00810-like [Humulus lupulus]|uniref:uncharacterized mitochondrial protein AtMg00810-like n=1 Tax=Humulus lupulus TaxID=3486 RepID=UPI002B410DB8|nr:uncharacterized mitochondrial protein AtMg00810-like [Humulus lupulus]
MSVLIVYVDDIIVTGNHIEEMSMIKERLAKEFEVKDLGALRYFLGMEFARSKRGISVSQRKYTLDLLKEPGMLGSKPNKTPIELGDKRRMFEGSPVDKGRYQQLAGKLIYLSHTRPDIAFMVSLVSQYMHNPCQGHLNVVYRIMRYLKQKPGKCLFFKKTNERKIEVFTNADWAGSVDDRKSTPGYCMIVWGNVVTLRSKKQTVVARSSAKAEYRAMAHGVCEAIWIKRLLEELKIEYVAPINFIVIISLPSALHIILYIMIELTHVEVDRHFIKEKIDGGIISIRYIHT